MHRTSKHTTASQLPQNNCIDLSQDISMIDMNVTQVYSEWYDVGSNEEIDKLMYVL